MRSESTQECLLTKKEPTLQHVLELVLSLEVAQKNMQMLQATEVQVLHKMDGNNFPKECESTSNTSREAQKLCYHCRKTGLSPTICVFKTAKCHSCGKIGHITKVCRSTKKKSDSREPPGKTKWIEKTTL